MGSILLVSPFILSGPLRHYKMRLTPCILQSPSFRDHSILLRRSPVHMVHISGIVNLPRQCSSLISSLLSSKDMEIIIRRMSSSMPFSPNSGAENDQVSSLSSSPTCLSGTLLGNRSVDNVHTPHSSCGIVEHPLGSILEINLETSIGVGSSKFLE